MKMQKKNERQQNVEAVHTHTHTHTSKFSEKRKIIAVGVSVAVVAMVAMVVAIQLCMKKEIIKKDVLAGNGEPIKVADVSNLNDNEVARENEKNAIQKEDNPDSLNRSEVTTNLKENEKPKAMVDTSSWDTSKVTVYTDPVSGKKAPIPNGYVVSQVTGETGIDTGLVIYEGTAAVTGTEIGVPGTPAWTASCERNQWVWVPVPDVDRIYDKENRKSKLYNVTSTGRSKYSNIEPGISIKYDNEKCFSQNNLTGMTTKKNYYMS